MTTPKPESLLLRAATLRDGRRSDILIRNSIVAAVGAGLTIKPNARPASVIDMKGYLVLPAPAEPHAHLDKAMLAERTRNPAGDLAGAIDATRAAYRSMTEEDLRNRAFKALGIAVARGFTAIRSHVNCETGIGLAAIRALIAVRDTVRDDCDLQVFVMAGYPLTGAAGADNRRQLRQALELGADGVGGAPALDPDPPQAIGILTAAAADATVPIDLHLDETLDPEVLTLRDYLREVDRKDLCGRATASHCVSLGQQKLSVAREIARELAAAGVAVVTLPQTNLYLNGRRELIRTPRALTAIRVLLDAGVNVAAGGDNWRDPFNPVSRIDPFETSSLLVSAAHLDIGQAYDSVSAKARAAMHLSHNGIQPGGPADLLAIRAASLDEAVAHASEDRYVIRGGKVVSRTVVTTELGPAFLDSASSQQGRVREAP